MQVVAKAERLSMLDYLAAVNERMALSERMAVFHQKYDLLITPTLPITAFETNREVPPDWPNTRWPTWTPFTYPFNMTGQPALSVPLGLAGAHGAADRRPPLRGRTGAQGRAFVRTAPSFHRPSIAGPGRRDRMNRL